MENKNTPAFPIVFNSVIDDVYSGLTKRELFAAMAMQGLVTRGNNYDGWEEGHSIQAIHIADNLLQELEKQK